MPAFSWVGPLVAVLVAMTVASAAWADPLTEFEKAKSAYTTGEYDKAAQRFGELLAPNNPEPIDDPWLVERARTYYAAALIAINTPPSLVKADEQIEHVVRQNPTAVPSAIFPTPVHDRFTDIRAKVRKEQEEKLRQKAVEEQLKRKQEEEARRKEKERIAKLEALARQEVHVVHNSRWLSLVPFGVGQFQNDQQVLGWTFLTAELALGATAIISTATAYSLQADALQRQLGAGTVNVEDLNNKLSTLATIQTGALLGLGLVTAGGIAHAQLTFVPERREVKTRPLPRSLQLAPAVTASEAGAFVGVQGVF